MNSSRKIFPEVASPPQGHDLEIEQLLRYAKSIVSSDGPAGQFAKYAIRDIISDSGNSFILRANDPDLNRTVILKIAAPDSQLGQDVIVEGRTLATINSPHIVNVLSIESHLEQPYLVLEDIQGKTLTEFCDGKPVSEKNVLKIACQIANGLQEIHANGILHLDLKPGNVMITRDGNVKIIDFGLARRINDVSFNDVVGTPGFLSPERSGNQPGQINRSTDLFGLGGIMFYLLTAETPFPGEDFDHVMLNSQLGKLNLDAWKNSDASRATKSLVQSCVSQSPSERPQSAEAFARQASWIQTKQRIQLLSLVGTLAATLLATAILYLPSQATSEPTFSPVKMVSVNALPPEAFSPMAQARMELDNRESSSAEKAERLLRQTFHSIESMPQPAAVKVARRLQIANLLSVALIRQGKLAEAAQMTSDLAKHLEDQWPSANALRLFQSKQAEILSGFSKLSLKERNRLGEIAWLRWNGKQQARLGNFTGRDGAYSQLTKASVALEELAGMDNGWVATRQCEMLLTQLADPSANTPAESEIQHSIDSLRNAYAGTSPLEAELLFAVARHYQDKGIELEAADGESRSKSELVALAKASFRTADTSFVAANKLMAELYVESHETQANGLLAHGMLKYDHLNDRPAATELFGKAFRIYEGELGFRTNSGVVALITQGMMHRDKSEYEKAIELLERARQLAEFLTTPRGGHSNDSDRQDFANSMELVSRCVKEIESTKTHQTLHHISWQDCFPPDVLKNND